MRREGVPHGRAGIADEEHGGGAAEPRLARLGVKAAAQEKAVRGQRGGQVGRPPSPLAGEGRGGGTDVALYGLSPSGPSPKGISRP